jgi:cysteine desulfurase
MCGMIYLDYAATSPADPRVAAAVAELMAAPMNASSVHVRGQRARAVVEEARAFFGGLLNVPGEQVVFTSGASESNNLALRGFAEAAGRVRIFRSELEHACVRETSDRLAARGAAEVVVLPADESGRVVLGEPPAPGGPAVLCVMYAQNETGAIQPLAAARAWKLAAGAMWLCDAVQALGVARIDVPALGADLVSASSHKIGGPPGVGLLAGPGVVRLAPQISGGPQENEHRAGTQPAALIAGFAMAARLAAEEREQRVQHLAQLEAVFLARLRELGVAHQVNGTREAIPGLLSLSFPGRTGAELVIALDMRGIAVSSGSACATGVMEPSRALLAMFPADPARAAAAVRFSFGKHTTESQVRTTAEALGEVAR